MATFFKVCAIFLLGILGGQHVSGSEVCSDATCSNDFLDSVSLLQQRSVVMAGNHQVPKKPRTEQKTPQRRIEEPISPIGDGVRLVAAQRSRRAERDDVFKQGVEHTPPHEDAEAAWRWWPCGENCCGGDGCDCEETQQNWGVCTNPDDPNYNHVMNHCPTTCARHVEAAWRWWPCGENCCGGDGCDCEETQQNWGVCTNPDDPNYNHVMSHCPLTCAEHIGAAEVAEGASEASSSWVMGTAGSTCGDTCVELGKSCDAAEQSALTTNEAVAEAFQQAGYTCRSFHNARSYGGTPFSTGRSNDDCAPMIEGSTSSCSENTHAHHHPLCFCRSPQEATAEAPMKEAPTEAPMEESCPAGYREVTGDCPRWGRINGVGGGDTLGHAGCASSCTAEPECTGFEVSPSTHQCNLNRCSLAELQSNNYRDFLLCVKESTEEAPMKEASMKEAPTEAPMEESCPAGYRHVTGDCPRWGRINGVGGGDTLGHAACASSCTAEPECTGFEVSPSTQQCNLNRCSLAELGSRNYRDFLLCVKEPTTEAPMKEEHMNDATMKEAPTEAPMEEAPMKAATDPEFVFGGIGVDACPDGYESITTDSECSQAAAVLCDRSSSPDPPQLPGNVPTGGPRCVFYPESASHAQGAEQGGNDARVCNWCTGCAGGDTPRKPVFVDRAHGGVAYWLCKQAQMEEAPMKEEPMKEPPMKEAPMKEAPMKEAPMTEATMKEVPMKEAPTEAPMKEAPMKEVPGKEAPITEAPITEAPLQEEPIKEHDNNHHHHKKWKKKHWGHRS